MYIGCMYINIVCLFYHETQSKPLRQNSEKMWPSTFTGSRQDSSKSYFTPRKTFSCFWGSTTEKQLTSRYFGYHFVACCSCSEMLPLAACLRSKASTPPRKIATSIWPDSWWHLLWPHCVSQCELSWIVGSTYRVVELFCWDELWLSQTPPSKLRN